MSSRQLDEERIFHVARDLAKPETRAEYLEQVCAGDQALRDRVEALLQVHEQSQEFLKPGQPEPAPTVESTPLTERPGTLVGRYRLMEQIGEGGMGTVFVAEQERPIRRKVAIKVIKPGMDSKAVVARFEAERQALAMMDHSNIAKVLDAGTTDSGRPYFAMELVRGIPITDYCDQNKLNVCERLELFIQVCHAIQHAHQKGIIHRDIKPSNVLVTLHDGIPVPKVIDFGVAKALNARLTDRTIYTEHLQVIGTLLYMSPEQAELSGLDIDTRSDIYSLGVLLYELLTGTTPFQKKDLDEAAFDEQRRIIREKDPPRASVRISSLGETATSVAEHRKTDPKKLRQFVRGDLDWIVLRALEKDRTRRYETSNALAEDVRRFLAHEPVTACPPSVKYKVGKFCRRNRIVVVTATVLLASLTTGLLLAVAGYHAADCQRQQAVREAEKARLTVSMFTLMLGSPPPGSPEHAAGETSEILHGNIPDMLDAFGFTLDNDPRLAQQPDVEADIRMVLGWAYWRCDVPKALPHFQRALLLRRANAASDHPLIAQSLFAVGHTLLHRTRELHTTGNPFHEAVRYYRDALAEEEVTCGTADSALKAVTLQALAAAFRDQDMLSEALKYGIDAVAMHQRVFGNAHFETGIALTTLAGVYDRMNDCAKSEQCYRNAIDTFERRGYTLLQSSAYEGLGILLQEYGDFAGADTAYRASLDLLESKRLKNNRNEARVLFLLADLCSDCSDLVSADLYLERCVKLADTDLAVRETTTHIDVLLRFVPRLIQRNEMAEAERRLEQVCRTLQDRVVTGQEITKTWLEQIIHDWECLGQPEKAEAWQRMLSTRNDDP